VLHLTAEASPELIDKAYRLRMREVHPDLAGAARTDQAALVNAAGEILREPTARARYDALRTARRARPGASQGTPPGQQRGRDPGEERRRRELEEQLAASQASRRELAEQVQWLAAQVRSRPGRWMWASCAAGIRLGVVRSASSARPSSSPTCRRA
jgi:curved DNA-binding protein CbpA